MKWKINSEQNELAKLNVIQKKTNSSLLFNQNKRYFDLLMSSLDSLIISNEIYLTMYKQIYYNNECNMSRHFTIINTDYFIYFDNWQSSVKIYMVNIMLDSLTESILLLFYSSKSNLIHNDYYNKKLIT